LRETVIEGFSFSPPSDGIFAEVALGRSIGRRSSVS
jgi:hypothetical protein